MNHYDEGPVRSGSVSSNISDGESRKRPLDDDYRDHSQSAAKKPFVAGELMLKFLVSNSVAGLIIGKKGANVQQLQEQSGAKIKLSQTHDYFPGTSERVVLLSGSIDTLKVGATLIVEKTAEIQRETGPQANDDASNSQLGTVKLSISNSCAGMIIGKGGAMINQMMQSTGSKIHISQSHEVPPGVNERVTTIRGTWSQIDDTVHHIIDRMAEDAIAAVYSNATTSYSFRSPRHGYHAPLPPHQGQMYHPHHQPPPYAPYTHAGGYVAPPPHGAVSPMAAMMGGPETTITMHVADQLIGSILGKGGSIINEIQIATGSKIKISQRGDFVQNTQNRTVTISGNSQATQAAQYLINQKIMHAMAPAMGTASLGEIIPRY